MIATDETSVKVALVTGADKGVGCGIAKRLAVLGMTVYSGRVTSTAARAPQPRSPRAAATFASGRST
jgi:NAD(P)-dependent dehydrogenase (short-subunit alcohol dehydrogenase family)